MRDFESIGFLTELDSGLETRIFERAEIMALFDIKTDEELNYLLRRTQSYCKENRLLRVFQQFVGLEDTIFEYATTEGVYLISIAHYEKNRDLISELESDIAVRMLKFYAKGKTKNQGNRKKRPNLEAEDIVYFKSNKIHPFFKKKNEGLLEEGHSLQNSKIVITGNFEHFSNRNELASWLWEVGVKIDTGVSPKTDFLLVGSLTPGGSKIEKAQKLRTKILSEADVLSLFPDRIPDYKSFLKKYTSLLKDWEATR